MDFSSLFRRDYQAPTKLGVKGALGKAAPGALPVIQTISDVRSGANPFMSAGRNVTGAISGSMAAAGASVLAAEPTGFGWPVIAAAYDQGSRAGQDFFDSATQRFGMETANKSSLGNLPSTVNTNFGAYDEGVTLPPASSSGNGGSFRSSPPPSLNPEVPQTGTQTGGANRYVGMSEQEIKDAYDKLRYGANFDKARDYMEKGQSDPFDSTYNPSKYLVDGAGQKKAAEEGLKMHEAFFGPGGGRSRQLNSFTSSPSASITPARGSGMRNEGSATKENPFGTNFSGPLQNNTRGSDSFDRDKTPVRGMPTSEDHRKRQRSLRTVQRRLEENQVQRNLNQYSPVQYYTGNTGHSTGPHLDMRVWSHEKGAFVDPTEFMKYLSVGGKPVGDQFRMSSPYGMRDLYKNGNEKMHHGIDYATPEMTPIDVMGEYLTTYNDPGGGITSQYQIPGFDLILMHGHNKNKVLTPSYVTDGISRYGA